MTPDAYERGYYEKLYARCATGSPRISRSARPYYSNAVIPEGDSWSLSLCGEQEVAGGHGLGHVDQLAARSPGVERSSSNASRSSIP